MEIPKYKKFVCSECNLSGSLGNVQKEYNIQPDLLKGYIDHNLVNTGN